MTTLRTFIVPSTMQLLRSVSIQLLYKPYHCYSTLLTKAYFETYWIRASIKLLALDKIHIKTGRKMVLNYIMAYIF